MKQHLPSKQESLEIFALFLMVSAIQWSLRSWGWTALFTVGFVWNWAVLNGWVAQRSREKKYRFSVLRGITMIHGFVLVPFKKFPRIQEWAQVLPAGLAFGFLAYLVEAPIPWWAVMLGSLAFLLIRRQIRAFNS